MQNSFLKTSDLLLQMQKGSPVLFPTDTLPALGALPKHSWKLWELKKRPKNKPLILMGASSEELLKFALPIASKDALLIANKFWPGALTMVLPASGKLVEALNPLTSTLGMRVPSCKMTREFLAKTGPLATTSANFSGEQPSMQPEDISKSFPGVPLLDPCNWPEFSGIASTVIEWKDSGNWQLLRRGAVIPEMLSK